MIKTTNITTTKKEFNIECDICSTTLKREITKEKTISLENSYISNTDSAFCNECEEKFIKWIREKYPKDCWCKHIEEYKKLQAKLSEEIR
jgi:YgiT-type zinc finger domain-containing protein